MSGGELKAWNIGISLGTSSIRIAVFRNGAAEIIPDEQGNPEMPAWLSFLKDKPLIGATAKDNIAMNPRYTFHSINRFIGQSLRDSRPKCQIQHVGFKLSRSSASESSDIALATPKGYGVASMTVGEMLALLLLRAKMNAEAYLGGQVAGAVIGIPVRFTQYQRSVVRNAAEAAGLTVLGLLDTPASILLGHNLENDKVLNSVAIDMGAGFCNIGVATIDGRTVEMRSVRGNTYGGDDVDATLLRYLFRNPARRQNCHIVWDAAVIPRLRQICEGVKIGLSTATQYSLGPEVLSRHRAIKRDVVTRKEFEKACLKGWMSTSVLEGALKDAKMKKSEIHQIILAGSMSRIPALQTLLEEFFKRKLRFPAANDREEVEVRGLAFHAFQLASTAGPHQPHVRQSPWIKQVLTMSLGFETAEGKLLPIMPRNHPFPGRASDDIEISQTGLVIGRWLGSKSSSSSSTPTEGTVRSSAGFINVYESVSSDIKNCRLISRIDITTFLPVPYLRVIFDKDQDQLVTITIKHPYKALTVRAFLDERLIPLDSESELIRGQLIDSERASQMEIARAAEAQKFKNRLETLRSHGLQWRPFSSRDTEKKILTFIREADLWMEKNPDAPVGAYWGYNTALDNLRAQEDLGSDLSTFIPDRSSPKFSASVASDARADVADSAYIKNDWIDINHEILHSDSKHEHNENGQDGSGGGGGGGSGNSNDDGGMRMKPEHFGVFGVKPRIEPQMFPSGAGQAGGSYGRDGVQHVPLRPSKLPTSGRAGVRKQAPADRVKVKRPRKRDAPADLRFSSYGNSPYDFMVKEDRVRYASSAAAQWSVEAQWPLEAPFGIQGSTYPTARSQPATGVNPRLRPTLVSRDQMLAAAEDLGFDDGPGGEQSLENLNTTPSVAGPSSDIISGQQLVEAITDNEGRERMRNTRTLESQLHPLPAEITDRSRSQDVHTIRVESGEGHLDQKIAAQKGSTTQSRFQAYVDEEESEASYDEPGAFQTTMDSESPQTEPQSKPAEPPMKTEPSSDQSSQVEIQGVGPDHDRSNKTMFELRMSGLSETKGSERQQAEPEINMGAAQSPSSGIRDHARFREPDSKTKVKRELEEAEDRDSSRHLGLQATTSILWTPDDDLGNLFSVGDREVKEYTDKDFERVSNYLESRRHTSWVAVPRIYTVLRLIDQLDNVEAFVQQGLTDMWFPFSVNTLPKSLPPSAQTRFLEIQSVVFAKSKSFQLETSERKHAHFSANEPLPLQSIAKLGFGAHGSVDKVISTLTHKVYARKLFRKAKGLRREDVQTFRTELDILKRISHKHCVALVATYSDPKFFGLLMDPVGDYNLETFYDLASRAKNGDKLTLLRSFFGCLAEAVAYLHAQQIRHRDIKPQNIIVRGDEVFVADFGIAFSWEHLTRATTTADSGKTLIYAAPEVIRVEPRNEAADVWSLGCVFFEMATVLHGQTVKDLRDYFMDQSDSRSFHANLNTLESWAASLISSTVTQAHLTTLASTSNITFHWALKLLRPDPTQRLTAAALAEEIIKESASRGIHFCGDCCQTAIAASSTDDDDADDDDDVWGDED